MKKHLLKTVAFMVIASYIFTISFSLLRTNERVTENAKIVVDSAYSLPHEERKQQSNLEYFADAIDLIFKTIAGVDKVVKG